MTIFYLFSPVSVRDIALAERFQPIHQNIFRDRDLHSTQFAETFNKRIVNFRPLEIVGPNGDKQSPDQS